VNGLFISADLFPPATHCHAGTNSRRGIPGTTSPYRGLWRVVLVSLPSASYVRHSPDFLSLTYSPSSYSVPLGWYLFQMPAFFSSSNEPVCISFPFSRYHFPSPVILPPEYLTMALSAPL